MNETLTLLEPKLKTIIPTLEKSPEMCYDSSVRWINMDTKIAIKAAFMKLYVSKEYSHISMSELCTATPVARTTFYSYYDNTDSVRAEIEDELIQGLMNIVVRNTHGTLSEADMIKILDEIELFIKEHWSIFHAFMITQPNLRFIGKWKSATKLNFKRRYPEKVTIKNYELIAEMVASAVNGAYAF